jgi:hypothetical protein
VRVHAIKFKISVKIILLSPTILIKKKEKSGKKGINPESEAKRQEGD